MSYNFVGTTDKDDLILEIHPDCLGLIIFNLTNHLDTKKIRIMLEKILDIYNLNSHGIVVYYNGASQTTILERCKKLLKLIPIAKECQKSIQAVS